MVEILRFVICYETGLNVPLIVDQKRQTVHMSRLAYFLTRPLQYSSLVVLEERFAPNFVPKTQWGVFLVGMGIGDGIK